MTISNRLSGLDALRGIAAVSVMLIHYTADVQTLPASHLAALWFHASLGNYGVDLFFMISGFVIPLSLAQSRNLTAFWKARIARLFPAFWCAIALAILVRWCAFGLSDITIRQVLLNMTMVGLVFGEKMIDGPYWTLSCEAIFYLMAPLLFWRGGKYVERASIAWLITSWVWLYFSGPMPRFTIMPYAYLFVIGMMLYRVWMRQATPATIPTLGFAALSAFLIQNHPMAILNAPQNVALTAMIAVLFWCGVRGWLPRALMPVLLFLGEISYSLYLIHAGLGLAIMEKAESAGVNPNVAVLLAISVVIPIAWAMRRFVEIPGQRWIRSMRTNPSGDRARSDAVPAL